MAEVIFLSEIYHYGVKGQKWGVRRWQNEDGTLTAWGKDRQRAMNAAKTKQDVDSVFKTLSKQDKKFLGLSQSRKEWLSLDEGESVVKRFIKEVGGKPVAFLDIQQMDEKGSDDYYNIALATRNGKKYRGKGYATEISKEAVKWINKHPEMMKKKIIWSADPRNDASNKIAKKVGFSYDEEESRKKVNNIYVYGGKE